MSEKTWRDDQGRVWIVGSNAPIYYSDDSVTWRRVRHPRPLRAASASANPRSVVH